MFEGLGIDTCEECLLLALELLALGMIAFIAAVVALYMVIVYLAKTIWHRDLKYFTEQL